MKRKLWLSGIAAAVLMAAAGLSAHAQDGQGNPSNDVQVTQGVQPGQNPKPSLTFYDTTGVVKIKSSDLRKVDPFYQLVEQEYVENRITETEFKGLVQQRVESLGKLVNKINNEAGRLSPDQILNMTNKFMDSGGKFVDALNSDTSTSAELAGTLVDSLPATLQLGKDFSNMLTPALQDYFNDLSNLAGSYNEVVQNHPESFSPSERRKVNSDMAMIQSQIRLSVPSKMGTQERKLDDAIKAANDPTKQDKLKQNLTQAIDSHGGADVFRRSVKAQMSGDPLEIAASQVEMAAAAAAAAVANHNPIYDEQEEAEPEPAPVPVSTKKPVKVGTYHGQDPYEGLYVPEAQKVEPKPVPVPVPEPKPKPKPVPVQMVEIDRETGLPKPIVTHPEDQRRNTGPLDPVILHSTGDAGSDGNALLAMGNDEYDADYDPDLIASEFTLEGVGVSLPEPDGGRPRSNANGTPDTGEGFILSDEQSAQNAREQDAIAIAEAQGQVPRRNRMVLEDSNIGDEARANAEWDAAQQRRIDAYVGPEEPVYHEPDPNSGFTLAAQNGWYEMPDGEAVAAEADGSLPDGALAAHGQRRGVATAQGEDADSDYDVDRLSENQTRSARDGNFYDSDAFDAAMAALNDSIDANNARIEDQSDEALQRWDDYADEVYYDEEGNIHRVRHDRPVNDYEADAQDTRSATEIDRDNNEDTQWGAFEPSEIGEGVEVVDLEAIYAGYDLDNMALGEAMRSLSSAGNSLSSAGNSLGFDMQLPGFGPTTAQLALDRANGMLIDAADEWHTPTDWPGLGIGDDSILASGNGHSTDPALASLNDLRNQGGYDALYGALHGDNAWQNQPLAETSHDLAEALYGPLWSDRPYRLQSGAGAQWGGFTSGLDVATLSGLTPSQLRALTANDVSGGLTRLLAQPFNVLLTWGAGAYDLDLHMTGPIAEGSADRFHIYFAAKGALDASPYAALIKDCICNSGSEVILTSALVRGQVYRISVFDYGDQSASSTNLSQASGAVLQIVRGGTAVSVGNGTTIEGGHVIYTGTPAPGEAGNTWTAVEIDPNTGKIRAPDTITQSAGSDNVH